MSLSAPLTMRQFPHVSAFAWVLRQLSPWAPVPLPGLTGGPYHGTD